MLRRSNRYFFERKNQLNQQTIRFVIVETILFLTQYMQTYSLKIYLILNFQPMDLYKTFLFALLQPFASRKIFRSEHILYVPARAGQFNHASSQETIHSELPDDSWRSKKPFRSRAELFWKRSKWCSCHFDEAETTASLRPLVNEREREREKGIERGGGEKDNLSRRLDKFSISWLPPAWNVCRPKLETSRGWNGGWKGWTPVDFDRRNSIYSTRLAR